MSEESPTEAPAKHWGTYDCPGLTQRFRPFPIAGRGTLSILGRGLLFDGYRAGGGYLRLLAGCLVLFFFLIFVPFVVVEVFDIKIEMGGGMEDSPLGVVVVALFFVALGGIARWKRRPDKESPLRARVPWTAVWRVETGGLALEGCRRAKRGQALFRWVEAEPDPVPTIRHRNAAHSAASSLDRTMDAPDTDLVFIVGRLGFRKELRFAPSLPSDPVEILQQLASLTRSG